LSILLQLKCEGRLAQLMLVDLYSSHGTKLNGQRLEPGVAVEVKGMYLGRYGDGRWTLFLVLFGSPFEAKCNHCGCSNTPDIVNVRMMARQIVTASVTIFHYLIATFEYTFFVLPALPQTDYDVIQFGTSGRMYKVKGLGERRPKEEIGQLIRTSSNSAPPLRSFVVLFPASNLLEATHSATSSCTQTTVFASGQRP